MSRERAEAGRADGLVTASEVASYVYCAEQWRLQYGLGLSPDNRAALDAGTRHHARTAVAERAAGWAIAAGRAILVAALVLLLWWVLWR